MNRKNTNFNNDFNKSNYSRLELSEMFDREFKNNFKKENFSELIWNKILFIYNEFNENLYKTDKPYKLYCDSLSNLNDFLPENNEQDLYSNSRDELKEIFIKKFNNTYFAFNYSEENWNKILSLYDEFINEINSSIFPVELYQNIIMKLDTVTRKKEESYKNKLLYDYTAEEFKERFNKEFRDKYIEYNYTEENWEKVIELYNSFNEDILSTGYPFNLFTDTRYKLSQIESKFKNESIGKQVASKLGDIAATIAKGIKTGYNTVKFTFRILALNFASVAITMFIHLILGTFIYSILPRFVNDFMLQSIIGGLLFIVFNVMIFLDQDDKDVLNDPKIQIFKHACTIPFYAAIFLIFLMLPKYPVLEEIFPVFYPQMWISAFTEEYVFSPMIALTINCLLSIVIYLFVRKNTEY